MKNTKDFKQFLENLSLKRGTIYRHSEKLNFLKGKVPDFENKESLLAFFQEFKKDHTPSYLTSLAATIRRWGQFKNIEELKTFPMFGKKTIFIKTTMTPEEIKAFLNLPAPTITYSHWRSGKIITRLVNPKSHQSWSLFFKILSYTGMRTGEAAHLVKDDIDLQRELFILRDTKTNTPRIVPIPQFLLGEIKQYLDELKTEYLFPSKHGGNHNGNGQVFSDTQWHYNFHARINRLWIKRKNLTPYSLRHSFITNLISKDVNLFNIQAIVGHKNIKTTAQYVHLETSHLKKILDNQ